MNAGLFIKSTPSLNDTYFENTHIFISERNEKGAMGFVVNNIFPRAINELVEFSYSIPFPLYEGGPVDQEHLYFVHRCPDLIKGGELIADGVYFGGDFKTAMKGINDGTITGNEIKIFIGYCGWDYGELEEEMAEGSWTYSKGDKLFAG